MALTEAELDRCEDKFCATFGCHHYSQRGFIYCAKCMNGPPIRLGKEDLELKQRWDSMRRTEKMQPERTP